MDLNVSCAQPQVGYVPHTIGCNHVLMVFGKKNHNFFLSIIFHIVKLSLIRKLSKRLV